MTVTIIGRDLSATHRLAKSHSFHVVEFGEKAAKKTE